jgi:hypothetical protein
MSANGRFDLRVNGSTLLNDFSAGLAYESPTGELIEQVQIVNTSGAELVVKFYAGAGEIFDSRLTIADGAAITPRAATRWNEFIKTPPDGANVEAIGADPDRLELICYNNGTGDFWLRQAATASGGGIFLAPGASVVLTLSAAVRMYNPGPGTAYGHFVELLR